MIYFKRFAFAIFGMMAFVSFASSQVVQEVVKSIVATTCSASNWVSAIGATGAATCSQPAITNISGLGTNVSTFLATPSSANLASAVTDETGTGALVFGTTPTIATPVITGAWTAASSQTIGDGTASKSLVISSATSGTGNGSFLQFHAAVNYVGEYSSILGGAYDSALLIYNNSGIYRMFSLAQTSAAQSGTMCYNITLGAITYDASLGCLSSSMRFKHDWKPLSNALDKVLHLETGSFYYNDDQAVPGEQLGLNAENMAEVESRLVAYDDEGKPRAVRYINTIALLVKAIQEQQEQIDILKAR